MKIIREHGDNERLLGAWKDVANALTTQHGLCIGWILGQTAVLDAEHCDVASNIYSHVLAGHWDRAHALAAARVSACADAQRDGIESALSDGHAFWGKVPDGGRR